MRKYVFNTLRLIWKIRLLENILVRLTSGKKFGTLKTKFPPNHYQYKKGTIREVQRDGINYQLDLSNLIDWFIYYGFTETSRQNLYEIINKGDIIIDAGANIGDVTFHASLISGNSGEIHSFEPDLENFNKLKSNLSLNSFYNIKINNKGLGRFKGKSKLFTINENNRGMNRILKDSDKNFPYSEIEVTTIDSYIKENHIKRVDLIKIDVEGYEMNILKGSESTLDKLKPKLFIELDENNLIYQKSSAKELIYFLEYKGYQITNAETNEKITSTFDFYNCHFDIIGIMKS